jgi:hypothetical protein
MTEKKEAWQSYDIWRLCSRHNVPMIDEEDEGEGEGSNVMQEKETEFTASRNWVEDVECHGVIFENCFLYDSYKCLPAVVIVPTGDEQKQLKDNPKRLVQQLGHAFRIQMTDYINCQAIKLTLVRNEKSDKLPALATIIYRDLTSESVQCVLNETDRDEHHPHWIIGSVQPFAKPIYKIDIYNQSPKSALKISQIHLIICPTVKPK